LTEWGLRIEKKVQPLVWVLPSQGIKDPRNSMTVCEGLLTKPNAPVQSHPQERLDWIVEPLINGVVNVYGLKVLIQCHQGVIRRGDFPKIVGKGLSQSNHPTPSIAN
jgi:hypothetical protein